MLQLIEVAAAAAVAAVAPLHHSTTAGIRQMAAVFSLGDANKAQQYLGHRSHSLKVIMEKRNL